MGRRKKDAKAPEAKAPKDFKFETLLARFSVDVRWVPNERHSPEERRVWLQAFTALSIPAMGMQVGEVAKIKAELADAMLQQYRDRFMRREIRVGKESETGIPSGALDAFTRACRDGLDDLRAQRRGKKA